MDLDFDFDGERDLELRLGLCFRFSTGALELLSSSCCSGPEPSFPLVIHAGRTMPRPRPAGPFDKSVFATPRIEEFPESARLVFCSFVEDLLRLRWLRLFSFSGEPLALFALVRNGEASDKGERDRLGVPKLLDAERERLGLLLVTGALESSSFGFETCSGLSFSFSLEVFLVFSADVSSSFKGFSDFLDFSGLGLGLAL